jgi:aromatase
VVNGEVVDWTSRRELDRPGLRIAFAQERSFPPVTAMDGDWTFRPLADGRTEIVLRHRFAVDGDRRALERVAAGVDHNSEKELAALERVAAQGHPVDDVVLTFADTVPLPQGTASAYRFVAESDRWPTRLPHVRRVTLRRPGPGVQDMEMETVTQDGGVHTTRSLRLCFPEENRIVYTQLRPPSVLLGHSGSWVFTGGPLPQAVATHTVVIDAKRVPQLLGPDATLADARAHLRTVLGANSRATLGAASAGTEAGP